MKKKKPRISIHIREKEILVVVKNVEYPNVPREYFEIFSKLRAYLMITTLRHVDQRCILKGNVKVIGYRIFVKGKKISALDVLHIKRKKLMPYFRRYHG